VNITTLSFGSNQGERESNILRAVKAINDFKKCRLIRLSSLYETEPVGIGYSGTFINSAAVFSTSIKPLELLNLCKKLERDFGRKKSGDRLLDIDIILFGNVVMKTAELTIPHPRFCERSFVIVPMFEICKEFTVAPGDIRIADIADNTSQTGWIRKISTRSLIERS